MSVTSSLLNLIKNPKLYLAAAVGTIPGALTGGAIGSLSGCYIAPLFGFFSGYRDHKFGIDADLFVGGICGLIIGAILGGLLTGSIAFFKINKNKKELQAVSQDNIFEVLIPSLGISIELSIGMAIGAVIGSLKLLGIGTVLGAIIGTILILITSQIIKK
ncbi:hypothetical protein TUM19329_29790 [Legionella antarctica]|uniref:Transmembrane protein n=1 Tax=Legionella antarctica TaxID=2708020 RepID=A0A6F8T878_9GAMM|nr:hypothetical protein [Legionella antarctica]BCA96618.1 hypothetical protein TUM19329_29790 [Legionella antarctica]